MNWIELQKNKIAGTPERIIDITAEEYGLEYRHLTGQTRLREYVTARYTAMYLIKSYFNHFTLLKIGSLFSNRDHSSIYHALKCYKQWDELEMINYNIVSTIIARYEDEQFDRVNPLYFNKSYTFLTPLR